MRAAHILIKHQKSRRLASWSDPVRCLGHYKTPLSILRDCLLIDAPRAQDGARIKKTTPAEAEAQLKEIM